MEDPQQEFYEAGYSQPWSASFGSRWSWLEPWLHSVDAMDLALQLLPPGSRLLDVGCGDGRLLLQTGGLYEELYGIDIAPVRIAAARKALGGLGDQKVDLRVVNIDREGLPFEEAYFDAVVMMGVLQMVFDVERAIREVYRVLKPGGVFLLETNNLAQLSYRLRLLAGKQPRTNPFHGWDGNTLHYFVLRPLVDMLSSEGLQVRRVCAAGRLSKFRSWWPSLLAENPIILASKE